MCLRARISELESALAARTTALHSLEQKMVKQARAMEDLASVQDELEMLRPVQAELTRAEV
jgi:hypothetical protein